MLVSLLRRAYVFRVLCVAIVLPGSTAFFHGPSALCEEPARGRLDAILKQTARDSAKLRSDVSTFKTRAAAEDTGLAHSRNFSVVATEGEFLARSVLEAAARYRKEIAQEWLGRELPPGAESAVIDVDVVFEGDAGWILPADGKVQKKHRIWLEVDESNAVAHALKHEVAHVVLCARFPEGKPAWIHEGIAGRYDDGGRVATRRRVVREFATSGEWPSILDVLQTETISPSNREAYTVAVSLTDYLLHKGGRRKLLDFASDGSKVGWESAVQSHYGLRDLGELETAWRRWASAPRLAGKR